MTHLSVAHVRRPGTGTFEDREASLEHLAARWDALPALEAAQLLAESVHPSWNETPASRDEAWEEWLAARDTVAELHDRVILPGVVDDEMTPACTCPEDWAIARAEDDAKYLLYRLLTGERP